MAKRYRMTANHMRNLFSAKQHLWTRHAYRLAKVIAALTFALAAPSTHAEEKPRVMDGTYVYAAVPGVGNDLNKGGDGIVVLRRSRLSFAG
jgi:hypothetical protein